MISSVPCFFFGGGRSVFQLRSPQAAGAHVGKNVQIHWRGFSGCPELDLITLGDDVYIGTAPTVGKCGPAWMKSERFQNGDF